ncbi:hypothetical protein HY988_05335 [Candidatus Micrarchaeota archaeon]|nr:hypothetical protein [Candidatus Micrarchaeota archaeon]
MEKMLEEDKSRIEFSKKLAPEFKTLGSSLFSSMSWPTKLIYPMFDARAADAVPNNYFQNIVLGEERLGNGFAHGAMRALFFAGKRLIVFSKTVHFRDGQEFFTSFVLLHLETDEYKSSIDMNGIKISADIEKPMLNLVTGKSERKKIAFSFLHSPVNGKIVSKEQVTQSARFKEVYGKYAGGAAVKAGSVDMEGYAVTVPHFAPHPYLLQLHKQFDYEENRKFQEKGVDEYLRAHLGK